MVHWAEFPPGYRVVAAPGSHHHEHLLQDIHCRVPPSWAPRCTPESTRSSPKCQAPAAGGRFPPCPLHTVSHRTWFNTSRYLPGRISLQGWQLSAGAANCKQGVIKHSPNCPQRLPSGCQCSAAGRWGTCAPRQAESPLACWPREAKPEPGFYPGVQSTIPSACPAGVSSRITMEQLLIHLGQPQRCLMATPVTARVSRGRGVPSGVGPSEALSFLPLVAPSWDFPVLAGQGGENPLEDHLGP